LKGNTGGDYWWDLGPVAGGTASLAITRAFILAKTEEESYEET